MSPLPLTGPLLGSQPLQFCVLGTHSSHSSPGSAAQAFLLVLQPGPLCSILTSGSDPGPGLPGPLDEMIALGSPPLTLQFTLSP